MLKLFYFYTPEMYTFLFVKVNNPVILTEAKLQYVQLFLWSPWGQDITMDIYLYLSGELVRLKRRRKKTGKAKSGLTKVWSKTSIHVIRTKLSWKVLATLLITQSYAFSYCFYAKTTITPWSCEFLLSLVFDYLMIYGTCLTLNSRTVKLNQFGLL